jgi:hypothetical protein
MVLTTETGNEATNKVVAAINATQGTITQANIVCGQVTQLGHGVEALAIETRMLLNTMEATNEEGTAAEAKSRTVEALREAGLFADSNLKEVVTLKKKVQQAQTVVEKLEECAKQRALADADSKRFEAQLREETICATELEGQIAVAKQNNDHLRGIAEDAGKYLAQDENSVHPLWESCENVVGIQHQLIEELQLLAKLEKLEKLKQCKRSTNFQY